MRRRSMFAICLTISIVSASGLPGAVAAVVVESVAEGSIAERAGIEVGDLLVAWEPNSGEAPKAVSSPFEFADVEIEYAPRGTVRLRCERGGESFTTELAPGAWGVVVGPGGATDPEAAAWNAYRRLESIESAEDRERAVSLATDLGRQLDERERMRLNGLLARALWAKRDLAPAIEMAGALVKRREELQPDSLSLAFSVSTLALAQQFGGDLPAAVENHERALAIRTKLAPGSLAQAESLLMLGMIESVRGVMEEAEQYLAEALRIYQALAPDSPEMGRALMWSGSTARGRGDLDAAEPFLRRAIELQQRIVPASTDLASSLDQLGIVVRFRGDLDEAEELTEQALAIHRQLTPGGSAVAASLNSLGVLAVHRGDLAAAQAHFSASLEIRRRLTPGGVRVATALNNLGYVAAERGDLASAEKYQLEAMTIYEQRSPGSMEAVQILTNLGEIAAKRGDLALAESRFLEVLAYNRDKMPGSFDLALALANVGNVALARDDYSLARRSFDEAAAIHAKLNPHSIEAANTEMGFGHLARKQKDLAGAESHYRKSLSIQRENGPASVNVAAALFQIGRIAYLRENWEQAETSLRESLAITRRLQPGSAELADASYYLGLIYRRTDRPGQAMTAFQESVEALEAQRSRLGGSQDARSGWASTYAGYYRDYIDLLVRHGRPEEALAVLERSHARGLLAMLAERDLVLTDGIPERLERRRLAVNARQDEVQQQMAVLDVERNGEKVEELERELLEIGQEREAVIGAIRRASPRLASLRYPEPRDLAGVREVLDPGTVMLAYSVGHERSYLFAVKSRGDLRVFELPIGRDELQREVGRFRAGVQRRQAPGEAPLNEISRRLFELLVQPAEEIIEAGQRVLICPDGPLQTLPFNALLRAPGRDGKQQYFIEWKPLHTVASATVYGELRRRRDRNRAPEATLVAFGDPDYEGLVSLLRRDTALGPLKWSRQEVEQIVSLFPGRARGFVGTEASEERAMESSSDARYVHFATHAILDERFPLNSALALSVPRDRSGNRPNGLLQAWEIFEALRLRADLVTLSGCETALGVEVEGEGLNSLTRAFTYAGAQSVLASLWSVADRSTSELMTRFYTGLSRGMPKDEALRSAQIAMLRSGGDPRRPAGRNEGESGTRGVRGLAGGAGFSHPYHWAAFQLVGDWR